MKIWDKIRIKLKIRKICKFLHQLSKADQEESMKKIMYCLKVSDDWRRKEQFLDILLGRLGVMCR